MIVGLIFTPGTNLFSSPGVQAEWKFESSYSKDPGALRLATAVFWISVSKNHEED